MEMKRLRDDIGEVCCGERVDSAIFAMDRQAIRDLAFPPAPSDPTHGRGRFSRRERVSGFPSRIVCCSCLALTDGYLPSIHNFNFSAPSRAFPSQYVYMHTLFLSYLASYTYVLGTSALATIDNRQIRSSSSSRREPNCRRCKSDTTTRRLAMRGDR